MPTDRDADASRLAAEALANDDPTGWFERLYREAAKGDSIVPWDSAAPNPLLVDWVEQNDIQPDADQRALVIGCGFGRDAEYVASSGFRTVAFDISPTAIEGARKRFPDSTVDYVVADILDPPAEWTAAFGLVVESITVQSMPLSLRATAIGGIRRLVAPGGELLVIAGARPEGTDPAGPPWPLSRAEVDSFAADGLRGIDIARFAVPDQPGAERWRAVFRRA
ncbi:methyltransferase family protein [Tamaricihabitans halophyticus]|uniref:Methyltransferase family protein n=1 Tax=Tamaricihabitans halophyticus TaxID=1262583 RepID=A0A4R2QM55_9PSEU|nr:class I SAM-dependent methyltransferase [Tamaricihabitans halophyticus]TCP49959.1 methyltransferase family protein [Tamaricihabitans halophyticus]